MKRLTTLEFVNKARKIHKGKFDYSLVEYIRSSFKVKIICLTHGIFNQKPNVHLSGRGCPMCKKDVHISKFSFDTRKFIEISREKHNFKYDYSKSIYTNSKGKLIIICKDHGEFSQVAFTHMKGSGCPKCVFKKQNFNAHSKNNPGSWSISSWEKSANKSKKFDSYKVYIIRCWNENERFYKIGRTFVKLSERFSGKNKMPYNYMLVCYYTFTTSRECHKFESEIKRLNNDFKYIPLKTFSGIHECFYHVDVSITKSF